MPTVESFVVSLQENAQKSPKTRITVKKKKPLLIVNVASTSNLLFNS